MSASLQRVSERDRRGLARQNRHRRLELHDRLIDVPRFEEGAAEEHVGEPLDLRRRRRAQGCLELRLRTTRVPLPIEDASQAEVGLRVRGVDLQHAPVRALGLAKRAGDLVLAAAPLVGVEPQRVHQGRRDQLLQHPREQQQRYVVRILPQAGLRALDRVVLTVVREHPLRRDLEPAPAQAGVDAAWSHQRREQSLGHRKVLELGVRMARRHLAHDRGRVEHGQLRRRGQEPGALGAGRAGLRPLEPRKHRTEAAGLPGGNGLDGITELWPRAEPIRGRQPLRDECERWSAVLRALDRPLVPLRPGWRQFQLRASAEFFAGCLRSGGKGACRRLPLRVDRETGRDQDSDNYALHRRLPRIRVWSQRDMLWGQI